VIRFIPEEDLKMKHIVIAAAMLLTAGLGAQAATAGHKSIKPSHARHRVVPDSSHAVVYNRDSRNPNVGWHWEGGMRTCHNDCDNPEIPGSGYTCRNVNFMGMAMKECDSSN
jgi:hypothetical protein